MIADISEERLGEDNDFTRADYNASANDNVIVQGITENPTSLGWVGFAFFEENQDVLKAVEVDSGESGCVSSFGRDDRQLRVPALPTVVHLREDQ